MKYNMTFILLDLTIICLPLAFIGYIEPLVTGAFVISYNLFLSLRLKRICEAFWLLARQSPEREFKSLIDGLVRLKQFAIWSIKQTSAPEIFAMSKSEASHPSQLVEQAPENARKYGDYKTLMALFGGTIFIISLSWRFHLFDGLDKRYQTFGWVVLVVFVLAFAARVVYETKSKEMKSFLDVNAAPNVEKAITVDQRPPVLYLRAFEDDEAESVAGFENRVAANVRRWAPLIGLGNPSDKTSRLGAYRSYSKHEDWQARISDYMERSRVILMSPGLTKGIHWELKKLQRRGWLTKAAIVFPPTLSTEALEDRFRHLVDSFDSVFFSEPLRAIPLADVTAIRFADRGRIHVFKTADRAKHFEFALEFLFADTLMTGSDSAA